MDLRYATRTLVIHTEIVAFPDHLAMRGKAMVRVIG